MKAGNLVFVQGTHLSELGIEFVTGGPFYHVALAVSDTEIIEALLNGVAKSPVSNYERYAVYECIGITNEQVEKAVAYAHSHLGESYDYLRDAGFFMNFILELLHKDRTPSMWAQHGKIICSSLVDLSLRSGGYVLREDRQPGDVTPMSLIYTPKVRFLENHNLWEV